MKFDKKNLILILPSSILSVILFIFSYTYLQELPILFSSIVIVAILIVIVPLAFLYYNTYRKRREMEDVFPIFLRDFVESIRGGMTVPQAFRSVSLNEYKALTPYVKKMNAQLDWGIPIDKVLLKFAAQTKSKLITRIVSSVIESHRFGGNLADTFEALTNTSVEVDKLRAERRLYLHSQMLTGYIIFFVFLAVLIGLDKFLVPSIANVGPSGLAGIGGPALPPTELSTAFKEIFRNLILIQGLFAGLTVGKMAEGSVLAGLKHSFFMMFAGIVIFTIGSALA